MMASAADSRKWRTAVAVLLVLIAAVSGVAFVFQNETQQVGGGAASEAPTLGDIEVATVTADNEEWGAAATECEPVAKDEST